MATRIDGRPSLLLALLKMSTSASPPHGEITNASSECSATLSLPNRAAGHPPPTCPHFTFGFCGLGFTPTVELTLTPVLSPASVNSVGPRLAGVWAGQERVREREPRAFHPALHHHALHCTDPTFASPHLTSPLLSSPQPFHSPLQPPPTTSLPIPHPCTPTARCLSAHLHTAPCAKPRRASPAARKGPGNASHTVIVASVSRPRVSGVSSLVAKTAPLVHHDLRRHRLRFPHHHITMRTPKSLPWCQAPAHGSRFTAHGSRLLGSRWSCSHLHPKML